MCLEEGCSNRTTEIWIGLCPETGYNVQHWLYTWCVCHNSWRCTHNNGHSVHDNASSRAGQTQGSTNILLSQRRHISIAETTYVETLQFFSTNAHPFSLLSFEQSSNNGADVSSFMSGIDCPWEVTVSEYGPVTMTVPASGHQVRCIPWVQMGTFNIEIGFLCGLKFFALNIFYGEYLQSSLH